VTLGEVRHRAGKPGRCLAAAGLDTAGSIGATFGFRSLSYCAWARPCERQRTDFKVPCGGASKAARERCESVRRRAADLALGCKRRVIHVSVLSRFMARNEARERVAVEVRATFGGRRVRRGVPAQHEACAGRRSLPFWAAEAQRPLAALSDNPSLCLFGGSAPCFPPGYGPSPRNELPSLGGRRLSLPQIALRLSNVRFSGIAPPIAHAVRSLYFVSTPAWAAISRILRK